MKKNLGSVDRILRVILAVIIAILFLTNVINGTLGIVLLVIAAVLILTSIISFCPLYAPFGMSSCPAEKK